MTAQELNGQPPPPQAGQIRTNPNWSDLLREDGSVSFSDEQVAQALLLKASVLARAGCPDGTSAMLQKLEEWPRVPGLSISITEDKEVNKHLMAPGRLDRAAIARGQPGYATVMALGRVLEGIVLERSGEGETAARAYNRAIKTLETCRNADKAEFLSLVHRTREAMPPANEEVGLLLRAIEELAERGAGSPDDRVLGWALGILEVSARTLARAGRSAEAEIVFAEVERLSAGRQDFYLRQIGMYTLRNKGIFYWESGRSEEARHLLEEVVRRYIDAPEHPLADGAADALRDLSRLHREAGRTREALAALDEIISRFTDRVVAPRLGIPPDWPGKERRAARPPFDLEKAHEEHYRTHFAERVAGALNEKGEILAAERRTEEALRTYDEVIGLYGDWGSCFDRRLLDPVTHARLHRGIGLAESGRTEDALRAFDDVVRRHGEPLYEVTSDMSAMALNLKGATLAKAGRLEEAVATFDEVVRRHKRYDWTGTLVQVATAMVNKGEALLRAGQPEVALPTLERVPRAYEARPEPAFRSVVEKARELRAKALEALKL